MSDSDSDYITCDQCNEKYHIDNALDSCDWCEHMRTIQTYCPECGGRLEISEQCLCLECIVFDTFILAYCEQCQKIISTDAGEPVDEKHTGHKINWDRDYLKIKIRNLFESRFGKRFDFYFD